MTREALQIATLIFYLIAIMALAVTIIMLIIDIAWHRRHRNGFLSSAPAAKMTDTPSSPEVQE